MTPAADRLAWPMGPGCPPWCETVRPVGPGVRVWRWALRHLGVRAESRLCQVCWSEGVRLLLAQAKGAH